MLLIALFTGAGRTRFKKVRSLKVNEDCDAAVTNRTSVCDE